MDAVIFDCDGVLIDSETIAHEVELEAFARLGLFVDTAAFKARIQGLTAAGWGRAIDELHVAQTGRSLPAGFAESMGREITRRILADIRPITGAVEAVRAVRARKAVASSSPRAELHGKIRGLGLWEDFGGHVHSGDDVEQGKPAPDIFWLAAGRLGVPADRCLVIEDSRNGVIAGRAAGMTVWGFAGGPHCAPDHARELTGAGAARVFADMRTLATALANRG
ncbi:MAG: HAD family phosphatase [Alphaproteobacteria bacterium]|nr:HAD family phosphatase [Alphaproteobacteria bacterium]